MDARVGQHHARLGRILDSELCLAALHGEDSTFRNHMGTAEARSAVTSICTHSQLISSVQDICCTPYSAHSHVLHSVERIAGAGCCALSPNTATQ